MAAMAVTAAAEETTQVTEEKMETTNLPTTTMMSRANRRTTARKARKRATLPTRPPTTTSRSTRKKEQLVGMQSKGRGKKTSLAKRRKGRSQRTGQDPSPEIHRRLPRPPSLLWNLPLGVKSLAISPAAGRLRRKQRPLRTTKKRLSLIHI